jgi:hypothetical protein
VTLRFPDGCAGAAAAVAPAKFAEPFAETPALPGSEWAVPLPTGFWLAYVDGRGYSKPFEVLGGTTDVFTIEF